jgi:general L-amino acid transport system permease protein
MIKVLPRSPVASFLTLLLVIIMVLLLLTFIDWAFIDATWQGASKANCRPQGACWAMIHARWDQFIYGFYPRDDRWRVNLSLMLLALTLINLSYIRFKLLYRLTFVVVASVLILTLLHGGLFLKVVPTNLWGGLFLTIFLAFGSMLSAFPLALLLALGRNSQLIIFKTLCVMFIEIVRGVPLISILFMAAVMLPLFFSQEIVIDKLLRAFIGIVLFQAAYLAEVIRGGLNSLPKGQYEAAYSLGMNYWQTTGLIVLPQALRSVIPGIVNNFIALFKDTTLVLIIGIYDFLGIVQLATTSPTWLGTSLEAYLFCGIVYWLFCFSMSSYSRALERKLKVEHDSHGR